MIELTEVKKGDKVLKSVLLTYGWDNRLIFWIPQKVERVTKTLIILEGGKRFRKSGVSTEKYERYSRSHRGKIIPFSEDKSELKEFVNTREKISFLEKINEAVGDLGKLNLADNYFNKNDNTDKLNDILNKLNEVKLLMEGKWLN